MRFFRTDEPPVDPSPAAASDDPDDPPSEPADPVAPVPSAITTEGRLLEKGWQPPTDTMLSNVLRREALRTAVERLKPGRRQGLNQVAAAIATGDSGAIEAAITNHVIGTWLDLNCQRDTGDLIVWLAQLENALRREVNQLAEATLASLDALAADPDARYLRELAQGSLDRQTRSIGPGGRAMPPLDPPPAGFMQLMVPR